MTKRIYGLVGTLMIGCMLVGCSGGKINADENLVTVAEADSNISLGYGNFVARYTQANYDMYFNSDMWDQEMTSSGTTFTDQVKESVLDDMKNKYAIMSHAKDYGVELSKSDKDKIDKAADKFMEDNSEVAIEQVGATKDYLVRYLSESTIEAYVTDAIKKEAKVSVSADESNQSTFSYVLYSTQPSYDDEGNATELSDDEKNTLKENAKALAKAEDFDTESANQEMSVQTYSYTTKSSDDESMDEAVIKAANALKEGEVSDVIEVEGKGYYVIRLDAEYDKDASDAKKATLEEEQREEYFNSMIEKWTKDIKWDVNESAWKKVKFDKLFKAVTKEAEDE